MNTPDNYSRQPCVAFYFALASLLWLTSVAGIRAYMTLSGELFNDRMFALHPDVIGMLPIVAICWVVAAILNGNSIWKTGRTTRYGIATLILLAIPATPLAIVVIGTWWTFLTNL